jgi:hypothetical protein
MRKSRLFALGALVTSFALPIASGCSSSDASPNTDNGSGGTGGSTSTPAGGSMSMMVAGAPAGGTGSNIHPLCGAGDCRPDDPSQCRDYEPPGSGGAEQGGASGGGQGGQGGESAGQAGQAGLPEGGVGGEDSVVAGAGNAGESAGGAAGASSGGEGGVATGGAGGAGEGGRAEPAEPSLYSCQVVRQNNQPLRQCELAGTGKENAPCFSASDCAAGLACVTEGEAGRCLFYCCSLNGECGPGTYCAERQQRKATGNTNNAEPAPVPVCVPADACNLEDDYPCPPDKECRCKPGTACMVVRNGTTTCLAPGAGQQGDACPCAWNHLCSSVTNQCVKICHVDPTKTEAECGNQKCQASAELPPNFGICVGPVQ